MTANSFFKIVEYMHLKLIFVYFWILQKSDICKEWFDFLLSQQMRLSTVVTRFFNRGCSKNIFLST